MEEPSWEFYRTFLAVYEAGSLSSAARALGLSQPTAGRHVEALEEALDTRLFVRTHRGLSPTRAAHALHPYASSLQSTVAALLRAVPADPKVVRGTVRISASEVIGVEVLPEILADLCTREPELEVELSLTNRIEDLLQRDVDIAVRNTRPIQAALTVRRLREIHLGLFAHRAYLDRCGLPNTIEQLDEHCLIGFDHVTPDVQALAEHVPRFAPARFALRTDNQVAQLALVRAGCGIGVCQVRLARRAPTLIRVLPDDFDIAMPTYVVMHEDVRRAPHIRVVFDALVDGLRPLAES